MLHLAADRDQLVSTTDADAEQPRQRVHHQHGLRVLPLLAHPRDGVKCVVEEMRIDLRLQSLQLRLAQVDLLAAHGRHQFLNPVHHVLERHRQVLHLAHARHRLIAEVVRIPFKAPHRGNQILDWFR